MKLYEITEQFKQLEKMEGLDPIALGDTIDSIKGDIAEKGKGALHHDRGDLQRRRRQGHHALRPSAQGPGRPLQEAQRPEEVEQGCPTIR